MTSNVAIVLAAGKGTRMKSELPKVLIPVCGRPMIDYLLDTLSATGIQRIVVVVGYRSDLVRAHLASRPQVEFAEHASGDFDAVGHGCIQHHVYTCETSRGSEFGKLAP